MTKHTPGPWIYTQGDQRNPHNATVHSPDGTLLHLSAAMTEQDKANARLIAGAPDLLAALKLIETRAMAAGGHGVIIQSILEVARTAIAKAC